MWDGADGPAVLTAPALMVLMGVAFTVNQVVRLVRWRDAARHVRQLMSLRDRT